MGRIDINGVDYTGDVSAMMEKEDFVAEMIEVFNTMSHREVATAYVALAVSVLRDADETKRILGDANYPHDPEDNPYALCAEYTESTVRRNIQQVVDRAYNSYVPD